MNNKTPEPTWTRLGFSISPNPQKFLEDQEKLRKCAKQPFIPTLEINTDNAEWDDCAKQLLQI